MKLSQIQAYLQSEDLDGWLLYDFRGSNPVALHVAGLQRSGSRRWFLWIPVHGAPVWLIQAIEASTFAAADPALGGDRRTYVGWQELEQLLTQNVTAAGRRRPRIAMEYSPQAAIPYVSLIDAGTKELVERITGAEIVTSADLVQLVQAVLSPEQQASHRRAAFHCLAVKDEAFAFVRQYLLAGKSLTEYDVQQFVLKRLAACNLDPDHPPIVAVNARAADPHYAPSAAHFQPIVPGDMLLIDLWGREAGRPAACFADITWTAFCGERVPAAVQQVFAAVAAARDAAVDAIREQIRTDQAAYGYAIDDACRRVIAEAGYGDYILHRTGHSLGSTLHFSGVNLDNLEIQDRRRLLPGLLFTVEPGIYMPDFHFDGGPKAQGLGIRSEINCLMHADRVEVTTLPLQSAITPLLA